MSDPRDKGCRCHCGRRFKVDIVVPDALWDRIRPQGKRGGAGLLCGECIAARIEALGEFEAYRLVRDGERVEPTSRDAPSGRRVDRTHGRLS